MVRQPRSRQAASRPAADAPALSRVVIKSGASACPQPAGMSLFDATGARKYLTAEERAAFLKAADRAERPVRTLCITLAYAGCRLSEALALTADRVDLTNGVLVFESLKKRCAPDHQVRSLSTSRPRDRPPAELTAVNHAPTYPISVCHRR